VSAPQWFLHHQYLRMQYRYANDPTAWAQYQSAYPLRCSPESPCWVCAEVGANR
jgi:hypothetical protein